MGANADGTDKLPLLVSGKSQCPRCFQNICSLPTGYDFSVKAWMTSGIYESWLRKLDSQFHRQQRSLIVDNCLAHPVVDGLTNVVFLPLNATSKLQPMDQGVIRAYRKKLLTKLTASRMWDMSILHL